MGVLISVGTAICGNSAIVATAPVIEADDAEVACAVTTITSCGVVAVFIYPLIAHFLHLNASTFGTWTGVSINDTSQVVAAAFIHSNQAGGVATIVKLTRTLFMVPVILLLGYIYTMQKMRKGTVDSNKIKIKKIFPWFLLGFLGMAIVRTLAILPQEMVKILSNTADYLITMAIAGVGLGTDFKIMRTQCFRKPLLAGLLGAVCMGIVSFFIIRIMGI